MDALDQERDRLESQGMQNRDGGRAPHDYNPGHNYGMPQEYNNQGPTAPQDYNPPQEYQPQAQV